MSVSLINEGPITYWFELVNLCFLQIGWPSIVQFQTKTMLVLPVMSVK